MSRKSEPEGRSKIDPKPYNDLVAHARLIGLRLTGSKFDIKPQALSDDREQWSYRINDRLEEWTLDCENLRLRSLYSYEVSCGTGRRKSVSLSATYYATYKLSRDCEEDAAFAYLQRVARYSCYPYFRALFAILTEQSGLLLPPLPVLYEEPRLVKADKEEKGKPVTAEILDNPAKAITTESEIQTKDDPFDP